MLNLILVMKMFWQNQQEFLFIFVINSPLSLIFDLTSGEDLSILNHHSAQVVFSSLLFEEIKFLEGFHSVDGKNELSLFWHTETLHGILELNIVEDDGGDVGSVLLGKNFFWSGLSGGEEVAGVVHDGCGNLGAEFSSVIVSFSLGERDSEREIL